MPCRKEIDVAYNRTTWEDAPSTNTPITAAALNNIEEGIVQNENAINEIKETYVPVTSLGTQVTYELDGTTLYITTK